MSELQTQTKEVFEKLEQMIEYRKNELERLDRSKFVKSMIQKEIDVLEFLADHAAVALKDKGIDI